MATGGRLPAQDGNADTSAGRLPPAISAHRFRRWPRRALRILGGLHGIGLLAMTNRIEVDAVRVLLRLLGTDIVELPGLSECPDPTTPNDVYSAIDAAMAAEPERYRHLSQYTSDKNLAAHYDGTGHEIHRDLTAAGIDHLDYLFGALGTTGSSRGAGTYSAEQHPQMRTVAVVSGRDDFIPGIRSEREMWEVGLFQPDFYDEIVTVDSGRAVAATLQLATGYGILAGPTSGAAYAAAREVLARRTRGPTGGCRRDRLRPDRTVPVLFSTAPAGAVRRYRRCACSGGRRDGRRTRPHANRAGRIGSHRSSGILIAPGRWATR